MSFKDYFQDRTFGNTLLKRDNGCDITKKIEFCAFFLQR